MNTATAPSRVMLGDDLILLDDVPSLLPKQRSGRPFTLSAVRKWVREGIAGVAPLESISIGRAVYTNKAAVARFFERIDAAKAQRRAERASASGMRDVPSSVFVDQT